MSTTNPSPIPLGAEAINLISRAHYPMILVDRILAFHFPEVISERYISANDFAFVGHFPTLKIWPGVLTIEGLRQTCELASQLHYLEEQDLLGALYCFQKSPASFSPKERARIEHALREKEVTNVRTQNLNIKLLAPVFAGCLMRFHIYKQKPDASRWTASAKVGERIVAKGYISL